MANAPEQVIDLIFGRWRSQILYAGAALGVFDQLREDHSMGAAALAPQIGADPTLLYRLLRALASIGLLAEDNRRGFCLTEAGSLMREDHPHSLKAMVLHEEGQVLYTAWKQLVPILRDGRQEGFVREFGMKLFDYMRANPTFGSVFNRAMTSYSVVQTQEVLAALTAEDFSRIRTLCDVGGGHGHLGCALAQAYPHLNVTILDLPEVVAERDQLWAPKLGLSERCRYVAGDMFREVPAADAYVLKFVLHDWSDAECIRILANARRAATGAGRVFVAELVVPGPDEPHFAKLFDIHMMVMLGGRERTSTEYAELLLTGGWRYDRTLHAPGALQSIVAATIAEAIT